MLCSNMISPNNSVANYVLSINKINFSAFTPTAVGTYVHYNHVIHSEPLTSNTYPITTYSVVNILGNHLP